MEKEKPPDDFFKGIKLSLKSVLKHPDINTPKITNAVILCNKIVINNKKPKFHKEFICKGQGYDCK